MPTLIVSDVASGDMLDRVTLSDSGLDYHTGTAAPLFDSLITAGESPQEAFRLRAGWSNGYVRTTPPIDVEELPAIPGLREQVVGALTAAFNPGQPRDADGQWSDGGAPEVDAEDEDDDGTGDDGDQFDNVRRFPSSYLRRYGHVVDEVDVAEDGLFVAKTDKGNFHVARGENDRQVLIDLDDDKAESLADFVLLFSENQPNFDVTDPISGATLRSLGDGGVRVEWPNGPASDLSEDGATALQEALRLVGPGFRGDDD